MKNMRGCHNSPRGERGPTQIPDGYVEVPEMAETLGVKEFTVAKWCRDGRLPAEWWKPTSRYGKWIVKQIDFDAIVASLTDPVI